MNDCIFCACTNEEKILTDDLVFSRFDVNSVTPGHCLIVTNRHVESYFDIDPAVNGAIWKMVDKMYHYLEEKFQPQGFNIGINVGEVSGQTQPHVHIHLIPRYEGDTPHPRGGVRGVIPEKQSY